MIRLIARRLVWAVFIVWAVMTLTFVVNEVLPGDAARMIGGPTARPQDLALIRQQLGIDRPLGSRYALFVRRMIHPGPWTFDPAKDRGHATCVALLPGLHLDFGKSFSQRRPVVALLAERLPRTLALGALAILIQLAIGIPAGTLAARRQKRALDTATVSLTLLGISAPTFLLGLLFQWFFAFKLGILPSDGFGVTFAEHAACAVLPALTLGVFGAAYYTRLVRDEMISTLKQDFVRTARAKGLSEWAVVVRHGLRNALMPLSTVIGLEAGALVGGAIVTEKIFRWPGIGSLSVDALLNRDGPLIMGTVILTSTVIVLANVVVDVLYAALDPRVR